MARGERTSAGQEHGTAPVAELIDAMEQRWHELIALRASPDMYGSESLDGQLSEVELWLLRARRAMTAGPSSLDRAA